MFFKPVIPTQIFVKSRYPDDHFWHPASYAYFESRIPLRFCFQVMNFKFQVKVQEFINRYHFNHILAGLFKAGLRYITQGKCKISIQIWKLKRQIQFYSFCLEFGDLMLLKESRKLSRKMLLNKSKKTALKFNPGLALINLQTTGPCRCLFLSVRILATQIGLIYPMSSK